MVSMRSLWPQLVSRLKHWRDLNADADEGAARTAQELWARWEFQRTAKELAETAAHKALERCEQGSSKLLQTTLESLGLETYN